MKLSDAFSRVKKTEDNVASLPDELVREMGLDDFQFWEISDKVSERIKGYYLSLWYCTDTWVGSILYFMDDRPLAVSTQQARKSSIDVCFVSNEIHDEARDYIISVMPEPSRPSVDLADMEMDIGDGFSLSYSGQYMTTDAILDGETPVQVDLIATRNQEGRNIISRAVVVILPDGRSKTVDSNRVFMKFRVDD